MINAGSISVLADGLAAAWAPFPRAAFTARALAGLDGLELKDRVRHVAAALHDALPLPYPQAAEVGLDAIGWLWKLTPHGSTASRT